MARLPTQKKLQLSVTRDRYNSSKPKPHSTTPPWPNVAIPNTAPLQLPQEVFLVQNFSLHKPRTACLPACVDTHQRYIPTSKANSCPNDHKNPALHNPCLSALHLPSSSAEAAPPSKHMKRLPARARDAQITSSCARDAQITSSCPRARSGPSDRSRKACHSRTQCTRPSPDCT